MWNDEKVICGVVRCGVVMIGRLQIDSQGTPTREYYYGYIGMLAGCIAVGSPPRRPTESSLDLQKNRM